MRKRKGAASEFSDWWDFVYRWPKEILFWLNDFTNGNYRFSQMETHHFKDETTLVWGYRDRLILKMLYKIIMPVFKYIISANCFHLQGPSGVKTALDYIRKFLNLKDSNYNFFIRADVAGYYASIDRKILVEQIKQHFDDLKIIKYLSDIITIAINNNGVITNPELGIPRRSSLSPFFAALYLSSLDRAFEQLPDIFYCRFNDDILILTKTKRQFVKAKKLLKKILKGLKLKFSRHKTKMGKLTKGFHFLGCNFALVRTEQNKTHVIASIHTRSCCRALDKIILMKEDAVNLAKVQRYLSNWAAWWTRSAELFYEDNLIAWIQNARLVNKPLAWFGSGLLLCCPEINRNDTVVAGHYSFGKARLVA